jgi:hypothetical protein
MVKCLYNKIRTIMIRQMRFLYCITAVNCTMGGGGELLLIFFES